jgi:hypothetical protein
MVFRQAAMPRHQLKRSDKLEEASRLSLEILGLARRHPTRRPYLSRPVPIEKVTAGQLREQRPSAGAK